LSRSRSKDQNWMSNRDALDVSDPQKIPTFYALGLRNYRLLWAGNVFASLGMWIQMATLGWLVYDMTGSGTMLGGMNAMRAIPILLLSPLSGVAADRMDRRVLMLSVQVVMVVVTLAMTAGLYLDKIEVWHLFAFAVVAGIMQVLLMPTQQTVLFDLVPRLAIPNAVALGSAAFNVTRVLGPSAAGMLIAWLGPEGNFLVQALAYVGVFISVAMIVFPARRAVVHQTSVVRNMLDGFRYVAGDATARMLLMMAVIPPLFIIPSFMGLMPVFAKDVFHGGPQALGVLLSATGLGGLLGALFTASLGSFDRRGLLELGTLLASGASLLLFALMDSMYPALAFLVVVGFCEMVYMTTNQTVLQLAVPDSMRGRVTSIFLLNMGLMPLGTLFFGAAADLVGAQVVVRWASLAVLLLAVLILALVPRMRNLRLSHLVHSSNELPSGGTEAPA